MSYPKPLEEVVISGISGVFSYSDSVDELRDNLFNKAELISAEDCRWKTNSSKLQVPAATGKLKNVTKFDASHFGIHRKQTESMDPMTWHTLERSFEAVMDAGINPADLKGTHTAVFMSSAQSDSDNVFDYEVAGDGFGVVGHNRSMLATRVSYYLDINGPSYVAISTWCGGLQVLSLAYDAISRGRCPAVIIGAPNLVLIPQMSWHLQKLGLLSADGKTRSFDADANGSGRGEAVVVLFLQRKRDAKRIYASVVGSETSCYGERIKFIEADRFYISQLLKEFYEKRNLDPTLIDYLEADGSATQNDREELNAVEEVLCNKRKTPLLIGCIKPNIGHTEATASLCSLVKVIIAMQEKCIPPTILYNKPAPGIPGLINGSLQVVTEKTPWEGGYAAVNAIGIDGSYAHAVLKSFNKEKLPATDNLPRLIVMSARTEDGLNESLSKTESMTVDVEFVRLLHDIHSTNVHNHLYRGYTLLGTEEKLREVDHYPGDKRPVWFIFSGMGSQWTGMAKSLMQLPSFAESIQKSHNVLLPKGLNLIDIITTDDPTIFDNILHSFVGIAAVQIALVDILQKLGIEADGFIGHSVGELGCAYADECLTAEQMIISAYLRGIASLEADLIPGMMAAIGLSYDQVKEMLPPGIDVACHNSSSSCTISGPTKDVEDFVAQLKEKKIFAKSVNVSNIAYHSRYIKPAAPTLLKYLQKVISEPKTRSSKWISTSVQQNDWDTPLAKTVSAEYLTNNLLSSVYFEEGCTHIPNNAICIEIAPHGLLQPILKKSLKSECTNIALTKRGQKEELHFFLSAIGKLYITGLLPHLSELYPPVEFPVSKGTPSISPLVTWEHSEDREIGSRIEETITPGENQMEFNMNQQETRTYTGHVFGGQIVLPPSVYLKIILENFANVWEKKFEELPIVFGNILFHNIIAIPKRGSVKVYFLIQRGTGRFEVVKDSELIVSGTVIQPEEIEKEFCKNKSEPTEFTVELNQTDVYSEFLHRGYQFNGIYKGIKSIKICKSGFLGLIKWPEEKFAYIDLFLQIAMLQKSEGTQNLQYPASIRKIIIHPEKLPKAEEDVNVIYNKYINSVMCCGVELTGLQITDFPKSLIKCPKFIVESVSFIPFKNPQLQKPENFISLCLQIMLECDKPNYSERNETAIILDLIGDTSITTHIEVILNTTPDIQVDIKKVDSIEEGKIDTEILNNLILVLVNENTINSEEICFGSNSTFVIAKIPVTNSWKKSKQFVTIMEQIFGSYKFILLRKVKDFHRKQASVIHISKDTSSWTSQLKSILNEPEQISNRIYMVSKEINENEINSFIKTVNRNYNTNLIRYYFICDKNCPEFSISQRFYEDQISKDLIINVYSGSEWGSIKLIPIDDPSEVVINESTLQLNLTGIDIKYMGLNKWDPAIIDKNSDVKQPKPKLGPIEFSGLESSGKGIMGLVDARTLKADQDLIWKIPKSWTLEEAATVPFAYSMAYQCLDIIGGLAPGSSVLVHSGFTTIGKAIITISLNRDYTVYTTVASEDEKKLLQTCFPKLHEDRVFIHNDNKFFHNILMETEGNGVSLVINTLTGDKMQMSLRCVDNFGNFIQLAQAELDKNHHIGMHIFLKSIGFFGVTSDSVFELHEDSKALLHKTVSEGIKSGVVKPFEKTVIPHTQAYSAIKMLFDDKQESKILLKILDTEKKSLAITETGEARFICNPSHSCLIVGNNTEEWLTIAEWLIKRGAKEIVVSHNSSQITSYVSRMLSLFQTYYNANIILSSQNAVSHSAAEKLIKEVAQYGPIESIFILPLNSYENSNRTKTENISDKVIKNLDMATRSLASTNFVCIFSDEGEIICTARKNFGLNGLSIQCSESDTGNKNLFSLLLNLDAILGSHCNAALMLTNIEPESPKSKITEKVYADRLNALLPSSLDDLIDIGKSLKYKEYMYEMSTLSPGFKHLKEVLPLFFVSGTRPAYELVSVLTSKIMYPLFNIKIPYCQNSISDSASKVAQDMEQIYPDGPFVLIGDLSGGIMALEVASILEKRGHTLFLYLLDGAPETIQTALKLLGQGPIMETNFLCKLLQIESSKIQEQLAELPNWESRLECALSSVQFTSPQIKQVVLEAILHTYRYITALMQYTPQYQISGSVSLILPSTLEEDNCGLVKLCSQTVSIHLAGKDHETMVKGEEVPSLVNNKAFLNNK